jgi:hypothetical protein
MLYLAERGDQIGLTARPAELASTGGRPRR